jgi:hypothetical protein
MAELEDPPETSFEKAIRERDAAVRELKRAVLHSREGIWIQERMVQLGSWMLRRFPRFSRWLAGK